MEGAEGREGEEMCEEEREEAIEELARSVSEEMSERWGGGTIRGGWRGEVEIRNATQRAKFGRFEANFCWRNFGRAWRLATHF